MTTGHFEMGRRENESSSIFLSHISSDIERLTLSVNEAKKEKAKNICLTKKRGF